jgi:small-conductance mechanosensitive channel
MGIEEITKFNLTEALDAHLFTIKGTAVTVGSILAFLIICIATILISKLIQRAIRRGFNRRRVTDEGTVAVTTRLTNYVVLTIGLGIALNTLGIDLTALFAAGAVFAVGIGFAMQTIAQNFVSGVILLVERSISPGDIIEINDEVVRVTKMSIRTTHARTLNDEEIILPNSLLVQSIVTNYTLNDTLYRISAEVGVSYESDIDHVHKTINDCLELLSWRVQDKTPIVRISSFGSSSVDFKVMVWIDDPWQAENARGKIHSAIWDALKKANITIAFPQLDLHLDKNHAFDVNTH